MTLTVLDLFSGIGGHIALPERSNASRTFCMVNRYTYAVPFTAEQLHADYVLAAMTQAEIGRKWGVSQHVVWRALHKMGIPTRKAAPRNQRMEANNNWRGGRTLQAVVPHKGPYSDRGYVLIYRPDHPHARSNGYIAEHVLNALEAAGQDRLPKGFCVHHINLKKDDNRPENLEMCNHSVHQAYHTQLEELAARLLLETGRIKFVRGVGYVEA